MKSFIFNDDWQFKKGEGNNWQNVTLPHDWLIYDTNNLYETNIGWYRKFFNADFNPSNERVFINFDGVYMDTTLYINDKKAGEWKYGYTAFEFDITDFLITDNENEIKVRVDYKSPNSRWYSGAGIYRDVTLKIKNKAHFITNGIYVTPRRIDENNWEITVTTEVSPFGRGLEIRHSINDGGGPIIENPRLWDINSPNLYTLTSELISNGTVVDISETRFGFREIKFTPNDGFYLNGKRVKINGVCLHHDLGCLGAAFDTDAARRQLNILKDMGVNAIRTSHNPPAAKFMELTDEMGFLVMSEFTDMWRLPKTEFDYARFFDEWLEADIASWIRRDRNCPSVIMWSIGNEIYDTHADYEKGCALMLRLSNEVLKHDPGKHAPVTLCSNYMPWENTQKCADIIKLIGYNYAEYLYNNHHAVHPDWIIYGGETGSTVQSRGVYKFPLSKPVLADDDMQCSALGNSATSWGAKNVEAFLNADQDAAFSLGQFIWTGTDYIGEPTPYHTKNSYFGHIDTAGFPKDSYYVIKSAWTDYKKTPFVHIFPYWDFSPGALIDVCVCSNAPQTELFLNNRPLGTPVYKNIISHWQIPYEEGELMAIAYDENGEIAAYARHSFGDTSRLKTDVSVIGSLAFCEITALDENENPVENARDRVIVKVYGGELIGLDNGDATNFEQYKTDNKRLFNGKLLAVIRTTDEYDDFNIKAQIDKSDIPIRKIELTRKGYHISAKVYPKGAAGELQWRLTDAGGIDSPLGALIVSDNGMEADLTPKGDGRVYIRCAASNGKPHPDFISHITLDITGLGALYLDPFTFISAGLYNMSNVRMSAGNERGIATLREGESHVGFKGLDFGAVGGDTLTLPLFPLSAKPFNFEIWEGMPLDGGVKLRDCTYNLGSVWNTYQEIIIKLPKRLKGITALCFVFYQKVHIKGFIFNKIIKAYDKLYAAQNDDIYGDSFTVSKKAVCGIGNNVVITFNDMDFGVYGARGVIIKSRSGYENNSVKFVFTGAGGEAESVMAEVKGSADYKEQEIIFDNPVIGKRTVELIFLPGCDIDLLWIRFDNGF